MIVHSTDKNAVIRALRDGYRLYYLPDQDFGRRDSVFVPFFGVDAATITGLSRMAASLDLQLLEAGGVAEALVQALGVNPSQGD